MTSPVTKAESRVPSSLTPGVLQTGVTSASVHNRVPAYRLPFYNSHSVCVAVSVIHPSRAFSLLSLTTSQHYGAPSSTCVIYQWLSNLCRYISFHCFISPCLQTGLIARHKAIKKSARRESEDNVFCRIERESQSQLYLDRFTFCLYVSPQGSQQLDVGLYKTTYLNTQHRDQACVLVYRRVNIYCVN